MKKFLLLFALIPLITQPKESRLIFQVNLFEQDYAKLYYGLGFFGAYILLDQLINQSPAPSVEYNQVALDQLVHKYASSTTQQSYFLPGSSTDRQLIDFYTELSDDLLIAQQLKTTSSNYNDEYQKIKHLIKQMRRLQDQYMAPYNMACARKACVAILCR